MESDEWNDISFNTSKNKRQEGQTTKSEFPSLKVMKLNKYYKFEFKKK